MTVPAPLVDLISRCLDKQPAARFQSASDLAFALRSILTGSHQTQAAEPARPLSKGWRILWFAVAAMMLVGVAATVYMMANRESSQVIEPSATVETDRVVVIPFENRTGDPGLDSLGFMAADWVTQGLAQGKIVEVVPATIVHRAMTKHAETSGTSGLTLTISQVMSATVVVSGAYYQYGEDLQFQVNVTDVSTGELLFAFEPESGRPDDPMNIIERIRQRVLGAMAAYFKPVLSGVSVELGHVPLYDAYLECTVGSELWGKDTRAAIKHFERAAELDPDFFTPQMWLIVIYSSSGMNERVVEIIERMEQRRDRLSPLERAWLTWGTARLHGQYLKALEALRKAERLAPNDVFVKAMIGSTAVQTNRIQEALDAFSLLDFENWGDHTMVGRLFFRVTSAHHLLGNYQEELKIARRSLEMNPLSIHFHNNELRALAALGALEEVDRIIEQCLNAQDSSYTVGWLMRNVALELRAHGHRDASLRLGARAIAWYQNRPSDVARKERSRLALGLVFYQTEKWSQALTAFEELERAKPDDVDYIGLVGCAVALLHDRRRALSVSSRLETLQQPFLRGSHIYYQARIAAILGEHQQAVELLREAIAQGTVYGLEFHTNIDLEGLRDDPSYIELMRPKT